MRERLPFPTLPFKQRRTNNTALLRGVLLAGHHIQDLQDRVQVARPRQHALRNVLKTTLKIPVQLLAQLLKPPPRRHVGVLVPSTNRFLPQSVARPAAPSRRITVFALLAILRARRSPLSLRALPTLICPCSGSPLPISPSNGRAASSLHGGRRNLTCRGCRFAPCSCLRTWFTTIVFCTFSTSGLHGRPCWPGLVVSPAPAVRCSAGAALPVSRSHECPGSRNHRPRCH